MTGSQPGPFLFGELRGTSWHRRFVAEEFRIFLDHYPEKLIILDSSLDKVELDNKQKMASYHEMIISLFVKNSLIDDMMPVQIINTLRQYRNSVFGPRKRVKFPDRHQKLETMLSSNINRQITGLKAALSNAGEIIYYPADSYQIDEDIEYLKNLNNADVILHLQDDSLPLNQPGINRLKSEQENGKLILTSNPWLYLEIFRMMDNFGFILDNTEWFIRGIMQKAVSPQMYIFGGLQNTPFPSDVDISGVQYCSLNLDNFLSGRPAESYEKDLGARLNLLDKDKSNFTFTAGSYRHDGRWKKCSFIGEKNSIIISTAAADEELMTVNPIFLDRCAGPSEMDLSGHGILSSFNYYFTDNLLELYNKSVDSAQRHSMSNFFIDYIGITKGNDFSETLPLYNKAYLGCKKDGGLFAGYYPLDDVEFSNNGYSVYFNRSRINPEGDGSRIGLYLPSSGRTKAGGSYTLVIIQDRIIHRGKGLYNIPPTGAVIVLESPAFADTETITIKTRLKGLPTDQKNLDWLVGGFNLLINDGKNLVENYETAQKHMRKEGWYSEASSMTQETQLLPGIKQPRVVLGKTKSGRLIITSFSGRTKLSAGATFEECASFVEEIATADEKIEFLINLDGGASASLTAYHNKKSVNLSLTAPSESNPAGVQRPVPAYLMIKDRTTRGDN